MSANREGHGGMVLNVMCGEGEWRGTSWSRFTWENGRCVCVCACACERKSLRYYLFKMRLMLQ